MKKILFFLVFFLLFNNISLSKTSLASDAINPYCKNKISENYIGKIDKLRIDRIEIKINKYKKWTVNGIRIITNNYRYTPGKYKKRFKAKILVIYENNIQCTFKGKVRHSGDAKDHIVLSGNSILQSLDVHLDNGHIRGITKFKLYLSGTRGLANDEILQTEILRNFKYLAPRTINVDVKINGVEGTMLFQEKSTKELLEYNNRREGPILEADQRFFFKLVEKIPDNQLSNNTVGTPKLRSKSIKAMLAKQSNPEIIFKSENHKLISYNALTNLNLIYLYFSNKFQDKKNNFNYFDYDLDNNLLGFFNSQHVQNLDVFNLLMQATNSQHALSVSNRKFYWNSIENYFEPIVYDTNIDISRESPTTTSATYRLPISKNFLKAFDVLEEQLINLDIEPIYANMQLSGSDLSRADIKSKVNKILFNLESIKKKYLKVDNNIVDYNYFKLIDYNILNKFNDTLNEVSPDVYLIKHNKNNGLFHRCKIHLKMCENYSFSNENLAKLLGGEFNLNKKIYQYLGTNLDLKNITEHKNYNELKLENTTIFYDDEIELKHDKSQNSLNILQKEPGARIYMINGELENLLINFSGYEIDLEEKKFDLLSTVKNYPIDKQGLTGCLSLINLKVKNISIKANRSTCEDAVNLINVEGNINSVEIKNSLSDGLDVDFSRLEIENVNINYSLNDCIDLSYGQYKLKNLNLSNCGDKGLSVGEKSILFLNKINVTKANTGLAVKDSSSATIKQLDVNESIKCIDAYRKKQEFSGSIVKLKSINCNNSKINKQEGSFIKKNIL